MKSAAWKRKIIEQMKESGTYREQFDLPISDLATLLELRDAALQQYVTDGSAPIFTHESDRGAQNPKINPALLLWHELEKTAIGLYKDLGLNPRSLKSIDENSLTQWQPLTVPKE